MCWKSQNLKIKTAKRNIPIWKIVDFDNKRKVYISPFRYYQYFPGMVNTTQMIFRTFDYSYEINGYEGFHSFSNKLKWEMEDNAIFIYKKKIFSNFKDYNYVVGQSNKRIARFHIPKGYQYAENKAGEIISSAIVFDSFID